MRVLLADDNRLLMEGLTNFLTAHHFTVVGSAVDGEDAIVAARQHRPDLILMDIRMPRCDGLCATRAIKAEMPEVKIVMLTASADDEHLFESIKSGATGYLLKSTGGRELVEALRGLEQGVPPFSPSLAARVLAEFVRLAQRPESATPVAAALTDRQIQVLKLVAAGLTYKEVGARLCLSERTIRYHMAEIMDRLHVEHRSEVIAFARRML